MPQILTQPFGGLLALHADVIEGWAFDPSNPQQRLAIEIYLNDIFVALVRADQ